MKEQEFEEIWKELTKTQLLIFVLIGNRVPNNEICQKMPIGNTNTIVQHTQAIVDKFLRFDETEKNRRNDKYNRNNNYLVYLFTTYRKNLINLKDIEIEKLIEIKNQKNNTKTQKIIIKEINDFLDKICIQQQKQNSIQVQQEYPENCNPNGLGLLPQEETSQSKRLRNLKDDKSYKKLKNDKGYDNLIGREEQINKIRKILAEDSNRIIAIDGIGGIGKTALTSEIAIRSLEDYSDNSFESVIWVSAKPAEFTPEGKYTYSTASINFETVLDSIANYLGDSAKIARRNFENKRSFVSELLQQHRYLVIIDNLETIEGYKQLVKNLERISYPSRIILTTRKVVGGFNHVQSFRLEGLEQKDSLIFLEEYSRRKSIAYEQIKSLSNDKLIEIHTFTGGLPLALELVVGKLASGYTWSTVRNRLQNVNYKIIQNSQASDENIYQEFYSFIYKDSWQDLSEDARRLIVCMGMFDLANGAKINDLIDVSEININILENAIAELIQFSLVERDGVESKQTFKLHPLTYHFVQNDIPSS